MCLSTQILKIHITFEVILSHLKTLFSSLTCPSPAAGLHQHSVLMEARSSTQRNPAQPGSLQVVQFVSDEPQQQVDQNQNRTHHPDQQVTHRTPRLRRDERETKEPDEDFPLLTFSLIFVFIL